MTRMFLLTVGLLGFILCGGVCAQGRLIPKKGKVVDITSRVPIADVNIYVGEKQGVAVTNSKGEFSTENLSHCTEQDTLYFSCVGYLTIKISLADLRKYNYVISLSENVVPIDEVVAYGKPLQTYLQYKTLTSLPNWGIADFASFLFNDEILLAGGDISEIDISEATSMAEIHNSIFENYSPYLFRYNLKTDSWSRLNLKFRARAYHAAHYYKGKMYILGGKLFSTNRKIEYLDDAIEVYDMQKDTVLVDYANPHKAVNFASCIYKDCLIIMGGSISENAKHRKVYSNKAHLLNLKTGFWYELPNMPSGKETKGILYGHSFYLFGGFRDETLGNIECYDISSGKWEALGTLPHSVQRPGIVCVDKTVYIFEERMIQAYNLSTGKTFVYRIDLPLMGSELFYANQKLYIVGGCKKEGDNTTPSPNVYSVSLSEFLRTETIE
ncbi:kelch repeat-containing protein [uncultured Bacteroides sp.]|uniref:Kelch repeat-containing protein n=1 Tax=uncultured Bacteroides sp. TaxID=162156 RepID=UPI002AA8572D|nr:kelch repeat-containing protein [uncultured Bacteroides sp.]